jgi:chromosome segregation ATPase/serine/threonine protein kinase
MIFYKRFLEEIKRINFTQGAGAEIHRLVFASAYQALEELRQRLDEKIGLLPDNIPADIEANSQLQTSRQRLLRDKEYLDRELGVIKASAVEANLVLEGELSFDDNFIHDFSSYFRDLKHLAEILSDAPTLIKAHQTSIYASILSKLSLPEQEHQLQMLSTHQISDLLKHAIRTFDEVKDPTLRQKCQQIVQMSCFELVARQTKPLKSAESSHEAHQQYQAMLSALIQQIPDVHESDILDSLSKYQNTQGETIGEMLYQATRQLNIFDSDGLSDESDARTSTLQTRKLCHTLRFGQDDRREYVSKRKEFMARDLFWARNIRDIELFTKSSYADDMFQSLGLKRYLAQSIPEAKEASRVKGKTAVKSTGIRRPVIRALDAVKSAVATLKFPIGDKQHLLDKDQKKRCIEEISRYLDDVEKTPLLKRNEKGEISIEFVQFKDTKERAESLYGSIILGGGFNQLSDTMAAAAEHQGVFGEDQFYKVTGDSLAEIREKLEEKSDVWKPDALVYEKFLKGIESAAGGDISSLRLNSGEELLLRKVLELYYFYHGQKSLPEDLKPYFKLLTEGKYRELVLYEALPALVDQSYQRIATYNPEEFSPNLKPVILKAQTIVGSAKERQEKLMALQEGIKTQDVQKLKTVFLEEYQSMSSTLLLSEDEDSRLAKDIGLMAEELLKLISQTNEGKPVFTTEEEDAYFSALAAIARQLSPTQLHDVQFKIPHSVRGALDVDIVFADGLRQTINIELQRALPYSLIKPPGDAECVFSYGGSRGIIAPFAGLDDAYAGKGKKKGRFFTHSRLLGVGQYGVVKEVEGLVTSLNQVIKKGFVAGDESTFVESSRSDLRTRPISARNDPLYRQESTILQALSKASGKKKASLMNGTQFWLIDDKKRERGRLFAHDSTPRQYQILTDRAQGDTFSDIANRRLNKFSKGDLAYHNPCCDDQSSPIKDVLAISLALVEEAEHFQTLGFSHNDIKPENFLIFRRPDGRYAVRYIDWATGGFILHYEGQNTELVAIFTEVFGKDLPIEVENKKRAHDNQGRFVEIKDNGDIIYGINPRLEILHGARNATLPYISPKVLGVDRSKSSMPSGVLDRNFDTHLETCEPMMDDWALTALTFGVCNRQAYFALAKGRVVGDYVIPGVIDADGKQPLGLKIVDVNKFNSYFMPEDCDAVTDDTLASGSAYQKQDAVMFIPSNQREGEPLHLYRRLLAIKNSLGNADPERISLKQDIEKVLSEVHTAIASGEGLSRQMLKKALQCAEICIKNYEKINDETYLLADRKRTVLDEIVAKYQERDSLSVTDLLKTADERMSELWVLCTYPKTDSALTSVLQLLNKAFDEASFREYCLSKDAMYRELLTAVLASKNPQVVSCLLTHVKQHNPDFINLVREQGLLHHALQEGDTDVATALVNALKRAGASEENIFDLLLKEYGTAQNQITGQPQIKWAINALKIAIQNGSEKQLALILDFLPQGEKYDDVISEALHLSAVYSQVALFELIEKKYNSINPTHKLTAGRLLTTVFAPDDSSPYHLFLRDEKTLASIDWVALKEQRSLGVRFLLSDASKDAHSYPLMVALANSNYRGLEALLELGDNIRLSAEDWQSFYKQTDVFGKSSLNYLLEQGHFDVLPKYLKGIHERASEGAQDVMSFLMSTTHPVNPLKNFLSTNTPRQEKLKVLSLLLNAICSDFRQASEQVQRARVTALLVNKEWLIEQAQDYDAHETLRKLLQNEALTIANKHILFKELSEQASTSPIAFDFYKQLLEEIRPCFIDKDATYIGFQKPIILEAVSLMRDDMSAVMTALTKEVDTLKQSLSRLELSVSAMTHQLHEKDQSRLHQEQLRQQAERSLADVNEQLTQLQQQMDLENRRFLQTEMGLKQQLERAQAELAANVEKVQGDIQLLRSQHQGELRELRDASSVLEDQRTELTQKYTNAQELLQIYQQELVQLTRALYESGESREAFVLKEKTLTERIACLNQAQRSALEEKALLSNRLEMHIAELSEARDHLEQLRQENQSAQSRLASVTAETIALRSNLDGAIEEKELRVVELEQQLAQAREENSSWVESLAAELAQFREQLTALESERDQLCKDLLKTQEQVIITEGTVTHLREELAIVVAANRKMSSDIYQLKEANATDLLGLRTCLQEQSKEAEQSRHLAQGLGEELVRVREENQRQQVSALSISVINEQIQEQLHAAQEHLKALSSESSASLDQAREENATISASLAARVEELTQVRLRIDELTRENEAIKASYAVVTEETKELRGSIEEKKAQVASLEQELAQARDKSSSEVGELTKQLAQVQSEIAPLTEQLHRGEIVRVEWAQTLADKNEALQREARQLEELRTTLETLTSQNSELSSQLTQIQAQNGDVVSGLRTELECQSRVAQDATLLAEELKQKLAHAHEDIQTLSSESSASLHQAREENATISASLAARVEELTQVRLRIDELTRENKETIVMLSSVTEKTAELRRSIEEKEARVADLEDQVAQAQQDKSSEVERLAAELLAAQRARDGNIELFTEQLCQSETERSRLAQMLAENKGALEEGQKQLKDLGVALAHLSSQNSLLRAEFEQTQDDQNAQLLELQSQLEEQSRVAIAQVRDSAERLETVQKENAVMATTLETRQNELAEAQTRIEQLRRENEENKRALSSVTESTGELRTRIDEKEARVASLLQRLAQDRDESSSQRGELTEQLAKSQKEIAALTEQLSQGEIERAELAQTLANKIKAFQKEERELEELRTTLSTLTSQNSELRSQLTQIQAQNGDVVSGLRSELKSQSIIAQDARLLAEQLKQQLAARVADLEDQVAQAQQDKSSEVERLAAELLVAQRARDKNIEQFTEQLRQGETERSTLGQMLVENKGILEEAQKQLTELKFELANLLSQNGLLKTQLQQTQDGKNDQLIELQSQLEEQLRVASTQVRDSAERLETAQKENAVMATTLETRQNELAEAQTRIEQLRRENEETKRVLSSVTESTGELRTRIDEKEARELEELRTTLRTLSSENSQLSSQLTQIQQQNEDVVSRLRAELDHSSTKAQDAKSLADSLQHQLTHVREENLKQQESATLLSVTNTELRTQLKRFEEIIEQLSEEKITLRRALSDLRDSQQRDLHRFHQEKVIGVLHELAGRIDKASRFIYEKAAGMELSELNAKYEKHCRLIADIHARWPHNQPEEVKSQYDGLCAQWLKLCEAYRLIHDEKSARPSVTKHSQERRSTPSPRAADQVNVAQDSQEAMRPQRASEPQVRPAAPSPTTLHREDDRDAAPPRAEVVAQASQEAMRPPRVPNTQVRPAVPSAPAYGQGARRRPVIIPERVIPRIAQEDTRPDPLNQSWIKIYSLLPSESDEERYSRQKLFIASEQGVLITINFQERQLNIDEAKKLTSRTGLNVKSPSGQNYSLNYNEKIPQALLTQQGALKTNDETDEQYQQRLAITIINMIDNVLSKGVTASVYTENPFIAKIAELYLNHLKTNVGIHIAYSEVKGCECSGGDAKLVQAGAVFSKLQAQLSKQRIETAPWYKEALKLREDPSDHHPFDDGGFVHDR